MEKGCSLIRLCRRIESITLPGRWRKLVSSRTSTGLISSRLPPATWKASVLRDASERLTVQLRQRQLMVSRPLRMDLSALKAICLMSSPPEPFNLYVIKRAFRLTTALLRPSCLPGRFRRMPWASTMPAFLKPRISATLVPVKFLSSITLRDLLRSTVRWINLAQVLGPTTPLSRCSPTSCRTWTC